MSSPIIIDEPLPDLSDLATLTVEYSTVARNVYKTNGREKLVEHLNTFEFQLKSVRELLENAVGQGPLKDSPAAKLFMHGFFGTVCIIKKIITAQLIQQIANAKSEGISPPKSIPELVNYIPEECKSNVDMEHHIYLAIIGKALVNALTSNGNEALVKAIGNCSKAQQQCGSEEAFYEILDDDYKTVSLFWQPVHTRWTAGFTIFDNIYLTGDEGANMIAYTIYQLRK